MRKPKMYTEELMDKALEKIHEQRTRILSLVAQMPNDEHPSFYAQDEIGAEEVGTGLSVILPSGTCVFEAAPARDRNGRAPEDERYGDNGFWVFLRVVDGAHAGKFVMTHDGGGFFSEKLSGDPF